MKITTNIFLSFLLSLPFAAVGCQQKSPSSDDGPKETVRVIVPGEMPTQEQQDKLLAAKESLFSRLSGRLKQVMLQEGPTAAITVCQKEAPQLAIDTGLEQKVRIGRTGVRLRNPANTAPDWAELLIEQRIDTPKFVMLSTQGSSQPPSQPPSRETQPTVTAAALLPIKLQAQCLMCHGPQEAISPEIKDQLLKLYPDDQATGFAEGELRGWFWVELIE